MQPFRPGKASPSNRQGKTAFAYVIGGKAIRPGAGYYAYEVEGENYFDFKRECLFGPENLILFEDGEEVAVSAQAEPVRFLLISESRSGNRSPGTADCDEYARGIKNRLRRIRARGLH